jgi:hypothetical protein
MLFRSFQGVARAHHVGTVGTTPRTRSRESGISAAWEFARLVGSAEPSHSAQQPATEVSERRQPVEDSDTNNSADMTSAAA